MSDLSADHLKALLDSVRPEILKDKSGHEYSSKPIFPIKVQELPQPGTLNISTLSGFVDFCNTYKGLSGEGLPSNIHIVSHSEVHLLSLPFGPAKQRTLFVRACFEELMGKSLVFNHFYDHETFIVGLQSLFEPTPERAAVLKIIGTIKENQVREFGDDGVTQSVAAKSGVALVSEVPVPNPVKLRPFRTFREIEQPESFFILRVRSGQEKPSCALFEADGGRWKLDAIAGIKEYLKDKTDYPIFA